MIDAAILDEIKEYPYGVLSFIDESGYPFSIPLTFQQKGEMLLARKPKSLTYDFVKPQSARVVFHSVSEDFTNPRQILLKGQIVERKNKFVFKIESFSRGKVTRKDATDEFIRAAKRRAQKYLDQKGITWYKVVAAADTKSSPT
jgi:hypothetical protein